MNQPNLGATRMRFRTLAMVLLFGQAGCQPAAKVVSLDSELEPLRAQFNADRGIPRFIALLSPT